MPAMSQADTLSRTAAPSDVTTPPSPLQIELRFVLDVPADEAFDLVAHRIPEWFGGIHTVVWDHGRSARGPGLPGACSERVCDFAGKSLREVIQSYEPGRRYAYSVDMDRSEMKMPLTDHLGVFEVEPEGEQSRVVWRQHFRAKWFVPAGVLRWKMRESMMRPAVEALIAKVGGRWA